MSLLISSAEEEAANRAEVTARLIRAGYRVYRPVADVAGEDLVIRDPSGILRSVQMKSRPKVDWHRYGGKNVWMLFPDPTFEVLGREWYLVTHDELFAYIETRHGTAQGWDRTWSYPSLPEHLRHFLRPFVLPVSSRRYSRPQATG